MNQYQIETSLQDPSREFDLTMSDPAIESVLGDLRESLCFHAKGSASEVITKLDIVEALDKRYEQEQKKWIAQCWIWGIVSLVFSVLAIPTVGITLIVAVPAWIRFFYCQSQRAKFRRLNVIDRRYLMPRGLLERLRVDIPPNSAVEVLINFNHYKHSDFLQEKTGGFLTTRKSAKYEIPWLEMKSQLMDGTQFKLRVTTNVKRKEKAKRKTTKITETYKEKYNLTLVVDPLRYSDLQQLESAMPYKPNTKRRSSSTRVTGDGTKAVVQQLGIPRRFQSTSGGKVDPFGRQSAFGLVEFFKRTYDALSQLRIQPVTDGKGPHV